MEEVNNAGMSVEVVAGLIAFAIVICVMVLLSILSSRRNTSYKRVSGYSRQKQKINHSRQPPKHRRQPKSDVKPPFIGGVGGDGGGGGG